uniref:ML domain-containing protein n=1 Tax=Angiostrongylus cantonensis TaxID=6313 RepID=A0A158PBY8_ANGCA
MFIVNEDSYNLLAHKFHIELFFWSRTQFPKHLYSFENDLFAESKFKIVDVEALGCGLKDAPSGKKLCEFKDETTPQIRIKFIPNETTANLTTQIKAKIGETFLEFPMADSDACKYGNLITITFSFFCTFHTGVKCPVEEGKESVYEKGIEIISNYPKVGGLKQFLIEKFFLDMRGEGHPRNRTSSALHIRDMIFFKVNKKNDDVSRYFHMPFPIAHKDDGMRRGWIMMRTARFRLISVV